MRRVALVGLVIGLLALPGGVAAPSRADGAPSSEACSSAQEPVPVLVAHEFIAKGTLGTDIIKNRMVVLAAIPCSQRLRGAIADPQLLIGRIVTRDVLPAEQMRRAFLSGVLKVSLTTPVRAGGVASLTVRVRPRSRCTIRLAAAIGTTALPARTGGRITWRWRVRPDAPAGRWPVTVRCGGSGGLVVRVRVLRV
jgi:hypothetical protein